MATRKITQLTELAEAPHDDDEFIIVDVSDTTMSPEGTNKRLKASNLPSGGGGGSRVFDVSNSFRANTSVQDDWYYGHSYYGWNYIAWSLRRSDFSEVYYSYCNSGIAVPAAFTTAAIRGVTKNSAAGNDFTFGLYKTANPDGVASSVTATLLVSQNITLTTANVAYKIDATASALTISEDDLLFFTVRRTSGGSGTNNTDVSITITLE